MTVAGLVLAGGSSQRMGSPKALLPWAAETFLTRIVRILAARCATNVVVTGAHDAEIRAAHPHLVPQLQFNANHAEGQFASIRCGLRALSEKASGAAVLLWPVDFAAVAEETVDLLLRQDPTRLVKPVYAGQSGHPVLLSPASVAALLKAPPTTHAKAVLETISALKLPVDDPACVMDADTPEDYERLRSRFGDRQ